MSRRLFPTLADYVIVAINPALVMTLVGSLVYFLLEMLYQGNYPERLHFSLTMFVFAIVLVSRIAMEEGFEHAAPFGIALAVVVWLAMQKFVDYGHGALAHFGWLVNGGLMAISWWCAHQLTWDSTVIDESEESEGQGLLETVGIDRASGEVRAVEQNVAKETAAKATSEDAAPDQKPARRKKKNFRWEDFLNRKDRPHAPGVWVVYFSLAALPIFGIGQAFIPATNTVSRRYAFMLFVVYVASGLGLLLTTSFLALRRYLRQRHLEMPTRMVGNWLTTGVVMIVALLAFVALLPRPNAEFAVSQLPWPESKDEEHEESEKPEQPPEAEQPKSSPVSAGQEGTRDKQATTGGGADHSADPQPDQNSQGGEGPQSGGKAEASGKQEDRSGQPENSAEKKRDQGSAGGKSGDQGKPAQGDGKQASSEKGGGSAEQKSDGSGNQSSQGKEGSQGDKSKDGEAKSKSTGGDQSKKKDTAKSDRGDAKSKQDSGGSKQAGQPAERPRSPSSPPSAPPPSPMSLSFVGDLLKWAFYVAVVVGGAYLAWVYWDQVRVFLQHWLEEWRKLMDQLFGRSQKPSASRLVEPVVFAPPPRSFSEYSDPFALGKPRGWSNADLVKYTFAALEAWSHDHGYDRRPDETPHEFARQVGGQAPSLGPGAKMLVDEYSRIVYGPGPSPQFNSDQLRRLWQTLSSLPAKPVSAGTIDGL